MDAGPAFAIKRVADKSGFEGEIGRKTRISREFHAGPVKYSLSVAGIPPVLGQETMRTMWEDAPVGDNGAGKREGAVGAAQGGARLPFFCDYPDKLTLGQDVSIGAGCAIVGDAQVSIGDGTILGARVQILSTLNVRGGSRHAATRGAGHRVRIGSKVRIGAGAIIGPGVTLADGVVIEAGVVVTEDVPYRPWRQ
jgi:acetyltransferase-like isoleucine patch superfamily enzyme